MNSPSKLLRSPLFLTLSTPAAEEVARMGNRSRVFNTYGITASVEHDAEDDVDGTSRSFVCIHASTEKQVGIGMGFLLALADGL